ncbi:MAG: hypothetical protein IID46_04380, partial [Planctomycetes bacterium]|nr:hypothetical protein [Planctomycetota bacterium]
MKRAIPFAALLFVFLVGTVPAKDSDGKEKPLTFERDIRKILKKHCFQCHGEEAEPEGGLDLRLRRLIVKGGESGPALVAGNPEESRIYSRILEGEMPPDDKKVSRAELAVIKRWITTVAKTARPEPESIRP